MTKVHATDYFHNTSKAPKKKERQQLLAHLKELGDTEATDARISNWFIYTRRGDKKRPTLSLPTSALEPDEGKWVDARHKSRKSLIPPSIISFLSLIHTLTDYRWRFSLAVAHKGVLGTPREALCPRRLQRRPPVRTLGGRSRCQTRACGPMVQVQSTRIQSPVAAGSYPSRHDLVPDAG